MEDEREDDIIIVLMVVNVFLAVLALTAGAMYMYGIASVDDLMSYDTNTLAKLCINTIDRSISQYESMGSEDGALYLHAVKYAGKEYNGETTCKIALLKCNKIRYSGNNTDSDTLQTCSMLYEARDRFLNVNRG